nr:MAG TPA: endonuclease-like protein [Caudoviricetes sp.]
MLLTKEVFVEISGKNKSLYQSLGYNIPEVWDKKHKSYSTPRGTKITILIEHLAKGSHEYVEVECDYCGEIIKKMYKEYLRRHDEELGDYCHKCEGIKYKRTMKEKYGVNHPFEVDEFKQKVKQTNQLKYGCDWQQQNPQVQEKSRIAMKKKYGVEHALQVKEFADKACKTKYKNKTGPTSKPQRALGKILEQMYGICNLEYPCGRKSLDCMVEVNNQKIDVEYDGWYYHQDKQRDELRDNFVLQHGYKILRIKSNKHDDLPTENQIKEKIELLLQGWQIAVIQM